MNLLPQVKSFLPAEGICDKASLRVCRAAGLNPATLEQLQKHFSDLTCQMKPKGFFAEFSVSKGTLKKEDPGSGFDAYVIQITGNGIRIDAHSESALFYGLQTLFQLPGRIPCGVLHDEAALKYRMIHWDLKGYQPHLPVLLDELRILASFKVNAILLEIEDKYDFRCAPEVGCPGAYSYEDMRRISQTAAALHIMIVPKLQCLAHADYVLKHKRYHDLREDGFSFEYCSSNPKAQKLWVEMATELMECFAEHPQYFHIGADEALKLGTCPECQKLGKAGSYIHKVEQCIDYLCQQGRTPILWEDILRNAHSALSEEDARHCWKLGSKSILMYWAYGNGGKRNTFPYLKAYQSKNMKVWGASGFSGCENWAGSLPSLSFRGQNIDAWTKSAIENQLECVVATGWTRIGSADCPAEPQESSWFTILYAAHSMWSGVPYDFKKFIYDLSLLLYGEVFEQELVEAIFSIAQNPYRLEFLAGKDYSNKRLAFLRFAAAAESLKVERDQFCAWNQYYFGRLGKELADYRVDYMNRWPVLRAEKIAALKKQIDPMVREFYVKFTADEFMLSRFGFLEKLIADTFRLTKKTKKC
ncbi:MAG: family 20 glycosylhydrolase [Lentisphaeria bacterium]